MIRLSNVIRIMKLPFFLIRDDTSTVCHLWKNSNFTEISKALNQVEWDTALDYTNIDACVSNFYDKLNAAIEENVPKMKLTAHHFPPWYTAELKQIILDKKEVHAKW